MSSCYEKAPWRAMIARCHNPKYQRYADYGGRGIKVCEEWRTDYEKYKADMGPRPSKDHSIDRIDNTKGYYKENCRWATRIEQANNKRNNRLIELNGVTLTLAGWGRQSGVDCETIAFRLKKGWPVEKAIFHPVLKAKSGVPSVSFRAERGNWVVRICRGARYLNIGTYPTFFEAVCGRLGNDFKEKVASLDGIRC